MARFFKRPGYKKKELTEKQKVEKEAKRLAKLAAGNQKVRNAKKVDGHGKTITDLKAWLAEHPGATYFDSKLEWFFWNESRFHRVEIELKKRFILQQGFRYWGESVQDITLTPDFYLPDFDIIVDTKGHATPDFDIKLKWLKQMLRMYGYMPRIILLQTQADIKAFFDVLKSGNLTELDNVPKNQLTNIAQMQVVPLPLGTITTLVPPPMALLSLFPNPY